jgi:hypothetical protein
MVELEHRVDANRQSSAAVTKLSICNRAVGDAVDLRMNKLTV